MINILQGRFTSTGGTQFIPLRSGVTMMNTYNITAMTSITDLDCVQSYWQYGFPDNAAITYIGYEDVVDTFVPVYSTTSGMTLVDTSASVPGTINATVTAVSTAAIPVVSNSGTNGLLAGNIVRLFSITSGAQLNGVDFTVGYNTLTSGTYSLDYMAQLGVAGTTGSWMKVNYDPIYYPRRRYITKITQAANAVVTLSVTHGYAVGQVVRMIVPALFGMTQMNGLQATITAINTTTTTGNTITLDIDSSAFTAFAYPTNALTSGLPFSPAEVVPMGQDTAYSVAQAVDILSDATVNEAQIGLSLQGGQSSPAGSSGDVIYWNATIAFSVDND